MLLVEIEVGGGRASNSTQVGRECDRALEYLVGRPVLEEAQASDGTERIPRADAVHQVCDLRCRGLDDILSLRNQESPGGPSRDDQTPDREPLGEAQCGVPTMLERVGRSRGEDVELGVVELDPSGGRKAPIDLLPRPPWIAKVEIDVRRNLQRLGQPLQRGCALFGTKRERPVVEESGLLLGRRRDRAFGVDEVPCLIWSDLVLVFPADDPGGDPAGRAGIFDLDALRHQIPAGHSVEDLTTFGIVSDGADHQRAGPEPPEVPGHVERRTSKNPTSVGEMIEEHLAKNDRSGARWMHRPLG